MTRKPAPVSTVVTDRAHLESVGGTVPAAVVTGCRKAAFLTVAEAAVMLKVSEKTVRRLIASMDLNAIRIGRLVRIPFSEIDRLIAVAGLCHGGAGVGKGRD